MTQAEAKAYFQELAQNSGLQQDVTAAVLQALENQKFMAEIANGFTRHSEYSSALDKARNYENQIQQWNQWYQTALPVVQGSLEKLERLQQYEQRFGSLDASGDPGNNPNPQQPTFDPKVIEREFQMRDQGYAQFAKDLMQLGLKHFQEFGEVLDTSQIEEHMRKTNLPLQYAYKEWIEPKRQEKLEQQRREWEEKTKKEIERDLRSRLKVPVDATSKESTPTMRDMITNPPKEGDKGSNNDSAFSAFMEGWNAPGNGEGQAA